MNDRNEAQKRDAKKQEDASRCSGCNHPQKFCTCPKAGGGDGAEKAGTKEQKGEKSDTIPKSAAQKLIDALNEHTKKSFWEDSPVNATFKDVLDQYGKYSANLESSEREALSAVFWAQVKEIGTPIIEYNPQKKDEANVYFLFPKDKLANKEDLYLQGEFHGYGGVNGRNKLDELPNTGIMYRIDSIPINARIAYQYQQVGASTLNDDNSSHRNVYHGYPGGMIFRVNTDHEQSHLGKREQENCWDRMISSESANSGSFRYQTTLYSDSTNKLHTCDAPLPQKVDIYNPVPTKLDEIKGEDFSVSPYADFTRAVHIFKPTSDEIENVIFINDGRPYILAGIMENFENMVNTGKLSANTAFVFIDTLQGLAKTMPDIEKDERFNMEGMGVRVIDFDKGIDNYIIFLETLFPQLSEKDINIPNDPRNRLMVGSSLSGTASIYIALKKPDIFNGVIAQSCSPSNNEILTGIHANPQANIQLSCGVFEQPRYNGVDTDCFKYVKELAVRLKLQFHEGFHGHNHAAWAEDLTRSLPACYKVRDEEVHKSDLVSEDKDASKRSELSGRSSRSVLFGAPPILGYPRANQNNMSVTSKMDPDPGKEQDDAQSKSSLSKSPFATPTLKPRGHD